MDRESIDDLKKKIKELEAENKRLASGLPVMKERLGFLQVLLNSIVMPVFFKDVDGVYKDCNPAFARGILGLPLEEVKGKSLFDLPSKIPHDLAKKYHQQDLDLMKKEGTQIYEYKVKRSDGTLGEYVFYKSPTYKADGDLSGIVGIMLDITERKKMEGELIESNQRMETLMEAAHVGIAIHEKGKVLDVNPATCNILGYSADEMIGRDVLSFFPEESHSFLEKFIESEESSSFDSMCFTKEGKLIPVAISGRRFPYKDRIVRVAELIDLTEREELNRKLNQAKEEVETLEELLPICAHCKKIRNDSGYWEQIEKYFSSHSDVQFTHGLCPACLEEIYGDKEWYKKRKSEGQDKDRKG